MKRQNPLHHPREGKPLSRKQFVTIMIGLGVLLILLVVGFLYGRWVLSSWMEDRTAGSPSDSGSAAATSTVSSMSTLPPVPDRQNGSLASLPDIAFTRGRTLAIGVSDPFGLINPLYVTGDSDEDAVALIFEPLLRLDQMGEPELILADELATDLQKGTLTIRIREDHIWRDGRSVNADDVVFTYQCLIAASYDGPLKGRFDDIKSVAAGPKNVSGQSVVFTLQPGVPSLDPALLTVGILKSDYYQVPADRIFDMGRKALPPEGSGAFQWKATDDGRRILTLRDGFAGDVHTIQQIVVGSDDKYPMLLNGELDLVRHDWNARIEARTERLMGYSLFKAERTEFYLLTSPNREKAGLPADESAIRDMIQVATGHASRSLKSNGSLLLHYFSGIEPAEENARTAFARQIADRLISAGQPVTLAALTLPELAEKAMFGDFQLLLLPAAADNRLPEWAELKTTRPDQPANAVIISTHPQIILVSARLANLTINPFGAPFAANVCTYTDRIANVRLLSKDGTYLTKEGS